jgi:hypothetical protein
MFAKYFGNISHIDSGPFLSSREGWNSEIKGTAIQIVEIISPSSRVCVPITISDGSLGNSDRCVGAFGSIR